MSDTKFIQFTSSAGEAKGFLACPDQKQPDQKKLGLIVLQEWWGIVPHIKDVTQRFAEQGFTALAPDLYHGKTTVDAEEASHMMNSLDWGRAAKEIVGAIDYLREKEKCTYVGIVGFCMGGALTIIGASLGKIDAYVSFYGFPPNGACDLNQISAPGLILFGEQEDIFSVPKAQEFVKAQNARKISTDLVVYPNAGHAFYNDTRQEVFVQEASQDAFKRTIEHLKYFLRDV